MSVTITVGGVDHTEEIEYSSVRLERVKTSQVDTLQFSVLRKEAGDWKPEVIDDVKIEDESGFIFGGTIIEVEEEMLGGSVERVNCTAKDYSFDMDRRLVADTFENETVGDIIAFIIDNYTTGFTYTNVVAPPLVDYIAFKYEYPTKCLQQLAELVGYDWYVDKDKDIHFFSRESTPAPFNLTDTNGKYYFDTLKVKHDVKNLRNTIIVRGGEYEGDLLTEGIVADGDQITFPLSYRYSNVTVKINGGANLDIGIDFIDDPADHDALYNFQEKTVIFPDATKPAVGDLVEVTGNPHIPVIVKKKSPASIADFGAFEFKVIDNSINTKEGARDRASAEIRGWGDQIEEASFQTRESGLEVGMVMNVQSDLRVIDQDYVVSKITSTLTNGTDFLHNVVLITTQTFGMMEFLQRLLIQKDKEIVINADEVIDLVEDVTETITVVESTVVSKVHNPQTESFAVGESTTVRAVNYAVIFVVGVQVVPTGFKRQFVLNGSTLL